MICRYAHSKKELPPQKFKQTPSFGCSTRSVSTKSWGESSMHLIQRRYTENFTYNVINTYTDTWKKHFRPSKWGFPPRKRRFRTWKPPFLGAMFVSGIHNDGSGKWVPLFRTRLWSFVPFVPGAGAGDLKTEAKQVPKIGGPCFRDVWCHVYPCLP